MAVKFQYNKVSMQALQKELKIRINALPTLKSKEAYLRITIKRQKDLLKAREDELRMKLEGIRINERLWAEFPEKTVQVAGISLKEGNIAGIKVPALDGIDFEIPPMPSFLAPAWVPWGIETIKTIARMIVEITIMQRRVVLLENARKKTTQKVNLYEKVQIPEFSESILKIKRYLEDVANLDKSAQKITKKRYTGEAAV